MKRVLQFLSRTDMPAGTYVWKAALISLIPSLIISIVVNLILPGKGPSFQQMPAIVMILGVVVFSPWVETLLMWPILWVVKRFIRTTWGVALVSAVIWGLLHSLAAPAWGFGVLWPFFVFAVCFLEWEKKSTGRAIVVTASVHMGQNLLPALAVLLTRSPAPL